MAYYPFAVEQDALYRLTSPTGVVAVFNDPSDPNYVGALTDVAGLDSAEVRESASDLVEADGGVHGNFYFSRRPITLSGLVFGHGSVAARNLRMDRARRASLALRGDANLVWAPSTRRDNFVRNPSVEVDLTDILAGQFVGGGTRTRVTTQAQSGTASVQTAATATGHGVSFAANGSLLPGVTYNASFYVKGNAGGETLDYYVADGVNATYYGPTGQSAVGTVSATTAWQRVAFAFTPTSVMTAPQVAVRQTGATARTWYTDAVQLERGALSSYFDGSLAGFYFQGNAHASGSADYVEMFVPVRRQQPFRESGAWNKTFQIALVSQYAVLFGSTLKTTATGVAAENRGSYAAYPTITITGTSANPTVSDGTRTFRTTGLTLASGEVVVFDMANHTGAFTVGARAGQSANRYIDFSTTTWPFLDGNGTTQTFSLTGGGTASISYRDTWA